MIIKNCNCEGLENMGFLVLIFMFIFFYLYLFFLYFFNVKVILKRKEFIRVVYGKGDWGVREIIFYCFVRWCIWVY